MERTQEERAEIAKTIIRQLGGNRFSMMTGAKHFVALESGLRFTIPGRSFTKRGINLVTVILDPSDTYTVKFDKTWKTRIIPVSEHTGIYDDMLQKIFTAETGLDTHL
jgi:hypothetical protein